MTIFGDNHAAPNTTCQSNCNFELHDGTATDAVMNYVFGSALLLVALVSMVGNGSVLMYYKKRSSAAAFSEFERIRQYVTIVRAVIDFLYNGKSMHTAYVLLSKHHEKICGEYQPSPIIIVSIFMYSLFMLSTSMTFVLAVLNYANINSPLYRLDFRHSYRLIIFFATFIFFVLIFTFELEGSISKDTWFSPIQLPFHRHSANIHDRLKWCLFGFKSAVLLFHIIVAAKGIEALQKLAKCTQIIHFRHICLGMIMLILGNCVCLIFSLIKDIMTNFLDFGEDIKIFDQSAKSHHYYQTYILFVADVFIQSLLSAYNPFVFITNSIVVRNTIFQAVTEAVTFTGGSVSKKLTRNAFSRSIILPLYKEIVTRQERHLVSSGAASRKYRTVSVSIWTSCESREVVSGSHVKFPLNHIPSNPIISIPVHRLKYPMTLPFVGQGSFGKVYKFTDHGIGCSVAIKHIDIPSSGARCEVEDVKKEVRINIALSHSNIVQYLGCCDSDMTSWCIILEFMRAGSLRGLLQKIRDGSTLDSSEMTEPALCQNTILKYGREMAAGLTYLHENSIIHRDLRASNVLISAANTAKLGDFGLSKKLEAVSRTAGDYTPDVGHPFWRSPEYMNNEECGPAVDVWSFGITILEMIYVVPPFMEQETFRYMYALYRHRHVPAIPTFVNQQIEEILTNCLQYNSQDRPCAATLFLPPVN